MKLTADMIQEIKAVADELEYNYIGVRIQEEPFEIGAIDHLSHVWDDGDDTGVELDGICAIDVARLDLANRNGEYFGGHSAIICGSCADYGADLGEIIIQDAEVVKIIC